MQPPFLESSKIDFTEYLFNHGFRRTSQRAAIIQAATSTKEHFTAENLLTMARKIDGSVSLATIYRTLPLLIQIGLLRELDLGGESKRYDPNFIDHPTHNHLICLDCQKIIEFEDPNMEVLENCITHRLGFSPTTKTLKIEAKCDQFAKHGTCKNRKETK